MFLRFPRCASPPRCHGWEAITLDISCLAEFTRVEHGGVAVCVMRDVASVEDGHDVESVNETTRVTTFAMMKLVRKSDEPASDVLGYGMVTRCHQLWRCHRSVHRQSCGHSSCEWKMVIFCCHERPVCVLEARDELS